MKSIVILILCTAVVVQTYAMEYEEDSQPFIVQNRIHDGEPAVKGQFPHMVYMNLGCGGSLIDAKWVLTAAHCVASKLPNTYKVYLGDINRVLAPVVVPVSKYYIHPERNNSHSRTDIALLELEEPVTFTENIKVIRLPNNTNDLYVGEEVTLIGKGRVDSETIADGLQYVNLNVLGPEKCRRLVKGFKSFEMCTGSIKSAHQGGCRGDSGNGLILRRPDGDTLIGVASLVVGECETLLANSFNRVNYFLDWMREITKLNI